MERGSTDHAGTRLITFAMKQAGCPVVLNVDAAFERGRGVVSGSGEAAADDGRASEPAKGTRAEGKATRFANLE